MSIYIVHTDLPSLSLLHFTVTNYYLYFFSVSDVSSIRTFQTRKQLALVKSIKLEKEDERGHTHGLLSKVISESSPVDTITTRISTDQRANNSLASNSLLKEYTNSLLTLCEVYEGKRAIPGSHKYGSFNRSNTHNNCRYTCAQHETTYATLMVREITCIPEILLII